MKPSKWYANGDTLTDYILDQSAIYHVNLCIRFIVPMPMHWQKYK